MATDTELDKENPDFDKIRHFKATWKDYVDFWEKKGARMTPYAEWEQEYPSKKKMKSNPVHAFKTFDDESKVQESTIEQSAGFAIVYNGKVLLAHSSGKPKHTGYSIPKGHIEGNESVLQAALRETKEEVGITVPKNLIPSNYKTVPYIKKGKGHYKDVHYYVVQINELSDIGLKDEVVPRSQLQLEEVDYAAFIPIKKARKSISTVMRPIIDALISRGKVVKTFEDFSEELDEDILALGGSQQQRKPMPKPFVLNTKKKRKGSNEGDDEDDTQEVANMNTTGIGSA